MDIFDAVATTECPTCQEANGVELPDRPADDSIARCRFAERISDGGAI